MTVWTIYMITGPNGKRYVGQTMKKLAYRWHEHKKCAERGDDHCLAKAIRKHGTDNFTCVALTECIDKREADAVEKGLIAQYGTYWWGGRGYNMTAGGASKAARAPGLKWEGHHRNRKGCVHTPESKARLSAARKGKPRSAESVAKQKETMRLRRIEDPAFREREIAKIKSPEAIARYDTAMAERRRLRALADAIQPRISVRRWIHQRRHGVAIGYKRDRASVERQRATMLTPAHRAMRREIMLRRHEKWRTEGGGPKGMWEKAQRERSQ